MHPKLFCVISCLLAVFSCSPGMVPPEHEPERQIRKLRAVDSPEEFAGAHRPLFIDASDDQLRRLVAHDDARVALAAGWERVRRTIPDRDLNNVGPEKGAISRFLGLVEGRLRVVLPALWEETVGFTSSNGRRNIWFPRPELAGSQAASDTQPAQADKEISIRRQGEDYLVTAGGETWSLPASSGRGLPYAVAVELTSDTAYMALAGQVPWPYSLHAVDRESGQVRWTASVWAAGGLRSYSGMIWHCVELVARSNEIVVFGLAGDTAYVESFDAKTGNNTCRFGTGYFEYEDEQSSRSQE